MTEQENQELFNNIPSSWYDELPNNGDGKDKSEKSVKEESNSETHPSPISIDIPVDIEAKNIVQENTITSIVPIVPIELKTDYIEIAENIKSSLRNFQIEGVEYAIGKRRTFIADEMGLGKTIEALATIESLNAYPCIVVCPASLKYNWRKEIARWLPNRTVKILSGDILMHNLFGTFKNDADIQIVNYDLLKNYHENLKKWGFKSVIFDESHYLKNASAKRTYYAIKFSQDIETKLLLTGTAILNRPMELIPQLKILGYLNKEFGGEYQFTREFCILYGINRGMVKNLDILNERMRRLCYIRRKKDEVLKELPAKQRMYLDIDITNRDEYEMAQQDLNKWLRDKAVRSGGILEVVNKSASTMANTLAMIEYLKQICARGKLSAVIERIYDFLEDSESKLVIFANHIEIQKKLCQEFPIAAHIMGEDSLEERNINVERFQTDPNCRIIVCSINVGGLGINLTAASDVFFVELGWTPAIHDQAEDRLHRIGQDQSVNITYFLGNDTIDQWIFELIEKKRVIVSATIDGDGEEIQLNIFNELIQKLRKAL